MFAPSSIFPVAIPRKTSFLLYKARFTALVAAPPVRIKVPSMSKRRSFIVTAQPLRHKGGILVLSSSGVSPRRIHRGQKPEEKRVETQNFASLLNSDASTELGEASSFLNSNLSVFV